MLVEERRALSRQKENMAEGGAELYDDSMKDFLIDDHFLREFVQRLLSEDADCRDVQREYIKLLGESKNDINPVDVY